MKTTLLFAVALFAAASTIAEMRTWTGKNGQSFAGELISQNNDTVKLKGADGRIITVPIARLCDADREYIAFNRPINLSVAANFRKSKAVKFDLIPHVTVRNTDSGEIQKQLDLCVLLFDADDQFMGGMEKQDFRFTENAKEISFDPEELKTNKNYVEQLVAFVTDTTGNIIASDGDSGWIKDPDRLQQLWHQQRLKNLQLKREPLSSGLSGHIYNPLATSEKLSTGYSSGRLMVDRFTQTVSRFAENGFDSKLLEDCAQAESSNAISDLFLPTMTSKEVLRAPFGPDRSAGKDIYNQFAPLMFHYCGKIRHDSDITFRFVGKSSGMMYVGTDHKCVLSHPYNTTTPGLECSILPLDQTTTSTSRWISLNAGPLILAV